MRVGLALLLALAALPAGAQRTSLAELDVVDRWARPLAAEAPVRVVLELAPGAERVPFALGRRWRAAPVLREGALVLEGLALRPDTASARPQHRRPSFLVDYDEAALSPVLVAAREQLGARPPPEALARFVDAYIEKKSLERGYDLASVVARRREGDCTEHAVLLAALVRASGQPARLVNGLALLSEGGRLRAFGHAWVEVRERAGWRVVDAALPLQVGAVYLPMVVLEDEGPAFRLHLTSALGPLHVRRVRVEPAGEQAGGP